MVTDIATKEGREEERKDNRVYLGDESRDSASPEIAFFNIGAIELVSSSDFDVSSESAGLEHYLYGVKEATVLKTEVFTKYNTT